MQIEKSSQFPSSDGQKNPERIHQDIEQLFVHLPSDIQKECLDYFHQLSPTVISQMTSTWKQEEVEPQSTVAKLFEQMNKEDRTDEGTFNREDIKEFNEVDLQLRLRINMQGLFSTYLKSNIIECTSFEMFQALLNDFITTIWTNRGKNNFSTPEQEYLHNVQQQYTQFSSELRNLKEREKEIKEKIGKRQRIPNNLQQEINETQRTIAEVEEKRFSINYEYHDVRGKRYESLRNEGLYKAGVYFSEHFSAEEYAILLLEIVADEINFASKFNRHANPELLDYLTRFIEEWAKQHTDEPALISHASKNKTEKMESLIKRFITSIQSYERHKDNEELSIGQRESLAKELPIMLRMLKKF